MRSNAQLKRSALIRHGIPKFEDYVLQRLEGKTHRQIQNEKNSVLNKTNIK